MSKARSLKSSIPKRFLSRNSHAAECSKTCNQATRREVSRLRCQPRLHDLRSSTGAGVFFGQQPHLLNIDRVMLRFRRGVMKGR